MDKRELYKVVTIDDREFRIGKFDAMTGSYIAYKLVGETLPMGIKIEGIQAFKDAKVMSKADFMDLQADCLKVCDELLPAGPAEVMAANGTWGVEDIKNNVKLALALTVHALVWNVMDFFDGDLLQGLSSRHPGYIAAHCENVNEFLFTPVIAGVWRQRELWDGTYTLSDLMDINEVLTVKAENEYRAREAAQQERGQYYGST